MGRGAAIGLSYSDSFSDEESPKDTSEELFKPEFHLTNFKSEILKAMRLEPPTKGQYMCTPPRKVAGKPRGQSCPELFRPQAPRTPAFGEDLLGVIPIDASADMIGFIFGHEVTTPMLVFSVVFYWLICAFCAWVTLSFSFDVVDPWKVVVVTIGSAAPATFVLSLIQPINKYFFQDKNASRCKRHLQF
eukprot:gb/GEZN01017172.1/.p1 GENE.gb/GEZN01017172.1/~~gb/GEZN01017172.1/.p1  ORF type:complete len:189 (+),score=9.83 gb/GEZN01017172.1/:88-654(+)